MNQTEKTIVDILVDDLFVSTPRADIDLHANLRTALGLDSLGFSELRAQCEYAFGVKIEDADFNPKHFDSVHTLAQLLTALKAG